MLARRAFFLTVAVTAVAVVPIFLSLRQQQQSLVLEGAARLAHDSRALLVVDVYPEDSHREGLHEKEESVGGALETDDRAENHSAEHEDHEYSTTSKEGSTGSSNLSTVGSTPKQSIPFERKTPDKDSLVEIKHILQPNATGPTPSFYTSSSKHVSEGITTTEGVHLRPGGTFHVIKHQRLPTESHTVDSTTEKLQEGVGDRVAYKKLSGTARLSPGRQLREYHDSEKWRPIREKKFKFNQTLGVRFKKVDKLYSKNPCTLTNETYHVRVSPTERELHEVSLVEQNLKKCVEAAELTHYFEEMNYDSTARKSAIGFLLQMRDVVPAEYSATHGNTSCWKSQFELSLCAGRILEGRLNGHPFSFAGHLLTSELQRALHYGLGGKVNSPVMCLPSIFVAGFPKCGTSFVYCLIRRLYQYKKWKFIESQAEKEPHFWVPGGPVYNHHKPHNLEDMSRYILNFLPRIVGNTTFSLPIDASPNTMFQWPRYADGQTLQNYCLVPSVLPVVLPHIKYIVVLRDPVTMLYSAFWFSTSTYCPSLSREDQLLAPDDFHHKVERKIRMFQMCCKYKPVDTCLLILYPPIKGTFKYEMSQCGRVRLEVGFYYYYIRRWLAVIPREQFLFLTTEELRDDLKGVSHSLSDFLELGLKLKHPYAVNQDEDTCKNTQSLFDYRNDPELWMRNDTRTLLYQFFDPFNQMLAELLQDSKFHWKPPE